jgi:hypothetical protein
MSKISEEVGKTVRLALRLALPTWGGTARLTLLAVVLMSCALVTGFCVPVATLTRPDAVRIDVSAAAAYGLSEHSHHVSSARPVPRRFTD